MSNYRIYANVSLGDNCNIGDFSSVGVPTRGYKEGELPTILGDRVEIQSHATICGGSSLGDDSVIGHGIYMSHSNRIGKRVAIGSQTILEWNVIIEDDVIVGSSVGIGEFSILEQGTWLGSQVALPSVLHPLCPKAKECGKGSHLYRGVTVGGGAVIYPDLRIGAGAYIEPCAVVVRDVSPYTVVAGNPAKEIGDIFTLYPGLIERLSKYVNVSPEAVKQSIMQFDLVPSLFSSK